MESNFEVTFDEFYARIGNLWFKCNDKLYEYKCKLHAPDCDEWSYLNAYYFEYCKTNQYGRKVRYTEHVTCFKEVANKLDETNDCLLLFDIDVNEEFKNVEKIVLRELFLQIHEKIIEKLNATYSLYLEHDSDDDIFGYETSDADDELSE